jgi:hypothetical protein
VDKAAHFVLAQTEGERESERAERDSVPVPIMSTLPRVTDFLPLSPTSSRF